MKILPAEYAEERGKVRNFLVFQANFSRHSAGRFIKTMNDNEIKQAGEILFEAENNRQPFLPLTVQFPAISAANAYRIQSHYIDRKLESGEKLIGRKVGLTSVAMQKLLQVDEPDFGCLTDKMRVENGGTIQIKNLIQPKVEAEIAFIINADISGKNVSLADVQSVIQSVVPSLEIIDSRIFDWRIKLADTIADNGSSSLFVIGDERLAIDEIDLPDVEMRLSKNGEIVQTGKGAAVLGHPLKAVLWLIHTLADFDEGLKSGDIVLPGALAAAVNAEAGDNFTAVFDSLGTVSVNFI